MDFDIINFVQAHVAYAYWIVFGVLLACGLGLPMPEDITLFAGGYVVYKTAPTGPTLQLMILVGLLGVLAGDTMLFWFGRWLGPKATKVWPFRRLLSQSRIEKTQKFFRRHGARAAFFARFAAGLRAPIYLLAGSMNMRFRTFFIADSLAALISVPLLVFLAWNFGAELDRLKAYLVQAKLIAVSVFGALIGIYLLYRFVRKRRAASATKN